ncbi:hypothetical protein JTB14_009728 [Gonioctena quinquepunctata]|nr:hypothetical protein JTB14_009728 [Gonioctena quinquepunctata]
MQPNIQILQDNELITDPTKVANIFNNFFISAPQKIIDAIPQIPLEDSADMPNKTLQSSVLLPFIENDMIHIFAKLKNKHSSGPDDLPCNVIKEFSSFLLSPITHIVNYSFETGTVPALLKTSKVIPVHKKNCRNELDNYRP